MSNSLLACTLATTRRLIIRFFRTMSNVTNTFLVPSIMFLIMRLLFGDFIRTAQQSETLNLIPLCTLMVLGAQWMSFSYAASESIRDRAAGLSGRVASLPCGPLPLFLGEFLYYVLRSTCAGLAVWIVALMSGMRLHTASAVIGFLCVIVLGAICTATLSSLCSQLTNTPETLMSLTPLLMCALFLSGGLVAPDSFVDAVKPFVRNNPVTHVVIMLNSLHDGRPERVGLSVLWAAGIIVVLGVLAVMTFRKRNATGRRANAT